MRTSRTALGIALVTIASACGGQDAAPESASDSSAQSGMQGMQGMENSGAPNMMAQVRAHMDSMGAMDAQRVKDQMPGHRQMIGNMLSEFGREMREMSMPADAAWNALADSVRQDLTTMPELDGAGVQAMMPAHQQRIARLMQMHDGMMKAMGH